MLLAIIFLYLLSYQQNQSKLYGYVKAVIIWTLFMFLGIELLSVFKSLNLYICYGLWGIFDVVLFVMLIRKCRKEHMALFSHIKNAFRFTLFNFWSFLFIGTAFITLFLSLKTVTSNYDSMTYHLPRIMHWAQNQSVAHYATNSVRQISSPVLSEFVNLYVYILSGKKDILFNLLQWSSYLTCTALVIGIARKLKCHATLCNISGLLFMSMPIAFAQTTTTQNDLFAAMWLLMFVYVILDLYKSVPLKFEKYYVERTLILSFCIAFGYLSKPSVMFAVLCFALGLLIACLKSHTRFVALFKLLSCSLVSIAGVLLPEIARNFYTFHAISAPLVGSRQLVETLNIKYIFINFLKNFIQNSPNAYFYDLSAFLSHCVYYLAHLLKVDINAPSIAEDGMIFDLYTPHTLYAYHHDTAVNPVVWWGFIISVLLMIILYRKLKPQKDQIFYCILSAASFLLLCMFTRWQRFASRYMIAYLALLCPVIVIMLHTLFMNLKTKSISIAVSGILIFLCVSELLNTSVFHYKESIRNSNIRDIEYFHNWKESKYETYNEIVQEINTGTSYNIGLLTAESTYEYPLWAMLDHNEKIRIEHIDIENTSSIYENPDFYPDYIFVNNREHSDVYYYHNISYYPTDIGDENTYLLIKEGNK